MSTLDSIGGHLPIDNFSEKRLRQNLVENFFRYMFPSNFSLIPDDFDSKKPCQLALVWLSIKHLVLILSYDVEVDEREYSVKNSHVVLNKHFIDLLSNYQGDRTVEYLKDKITKVYQIKDIPVGAAEKLWMCASDSKWEDYNSMLHQCMEIADYFANNRLDMFKPDFYQAPVNSPLDSDNNHLEPLKTNIAVSPKKRRNNKARSRNLSDLE